MFPLEIQSVIVEFINNLRDILNWRHICRNTFHEFNSSFYCSNLYPIIKTPFIKINSYNLGLACKRNYAKGISINTNLFTNNHLMKFNNLESITMNINCGHLNNFSFINTKNITELYHGSIHDILTDTMLSKFINIRKLTIVYDRSPIKSDTLSKLTTLEYLDYTPYNGSYSFLKDLTNLKVLKLIINNNTPFDKRYLLNLSNLEKIDIDNDIITSYVVKHLPNLVKLNCEDNDFTDNDIIHLTKLKKLICGPNCFFTDLSISNLPNLTVLLLKDAQLMISEELIGTLIHLQHLHCGRLQIADHVFKKLTKLQILECGFNTEITDNGLYYLPNLIKLSCGYNNNFTNNGIMSLKKLESLYCGHNTKITFDSIYNLDSINDLRYCSMSRFFESIKGTRYRNKFKKIKHIRSSNNYDLAM